MNLYQMGFAKKVWYNGFGYLLEVCLHRLLVSHLSDLSLLMCSVLYVM